MASTVINAAVGAPGSVTYPSGATNAALFNDMNIIIPDLIPELFDRYGAENYGMLLEFMGPIGGVMRSVTEKTTSKTRQFDHYEKGRAFPSGVVNADVTSATAGLSVTITLKSTSHTNAGTESGFRAGDIGFIGSTGVKFQVGTVTRTTGAFTVVLKPVNTLQSMASAGQASTILANETLLLVGNQAAGEGSDAMLGLSTLIYKITNSTTEIRDDYQITDVAKMNSTPINFGGGNYSYYKLAQTEFNKRYMYSVENAVIEGVDADNLGSGTLGTDGVIPTVEANGSEIDYTIGAMSISDLQACVRVWQNNGGPSEYHILQETNQQDDVDNLLFGKYNNGAIRYASVGANETASVAYGFKSFSIKGVSIHFWVYKNFSVPTVYGLTPSLGYKKQNYGLAIPQGVVADANDGALRPNMQWVYQEVVPGLRFHTWETGGIAAANKTSVAKLNLHQLCYVGGRTIAPQQFSVFKGTY